MLFGNVNPNLVKIRDAYRCNRCDGVMVGKDERDKHPSKVGPHLPIGLMFYSGEISNYPKIIYERREFLTGLENGVHTDLEHAHSFDYDVCGMKIWGYLGEELTNVTLDFNLITNSIDFMNALKSENLNLYSPDDFETAKKLYTRNFPDRFIHTREDARPLHPDSLVRSTPEVEVLLSALLSE